MIEQKIEFLFKNVATVVLMMLLSIVCIVSMLNISRINYLHKEIDILNEKMSALIETRVLNALSQSPRRKRDSMVTRDNLDPTNNNNNQPFTQYMDRRRYQNLHGLSVTYTPARPSYIGNILSPLNTSDKPLDRKDPNKKDSVHIRESKVMMNTDNKLKKSFKTAYKSDIGLASTRRSVENFEYQSAISPDYIYERHRNKQSLETLDENHPRTGRIKPLPTINLSGDTTKYVLGTHDNFNGNGHLRHLQRTFLDWKVDDWVDITGMSKHFDYNQGHLAIKEAGIYFVYAQIYYLDEHDRNGYRVYKNKEPFLQCTVSSHSTDRREKGNTCYTAGLMHLAENDQISVGDLSDGRYSLFEPGKSFFGLIKLGDTKPGRY